MAGNENRPVDGGPELKMDISKGKMKSNVMNAQNFNSGVKKAVSDLIHLTHFRFTSMAACIFVFVLYDL